ncbi:MAG: YihY/virulence factor BrkB family protein [Deltaproteobacteria bacterium]|nr:YihY/virulence factor BrkB family protein [Deltaproteobacteria bacterium]
MPLDRNSIAGEPIRRPVRSALWRTRDWLFEIDERTLPQPGRAALVATRIAWLAIRGLFRDRLHLRAASLSFHTVLAIVPALALAFAIGKATGLYHWFLDGTLRPFLDEAFGPPGEEASEGVAGLRHTADSILHLVEHTSLTGLGLAGLVVLVIALVRVVRGAEEAFGTIFEARGPMRVFHRRVRAFAVTLAVTPLGLVYAVTAASAAHWLDGVITVHLLRDVLVFVLPPLFASIALFVMYVELPDAEVRVRPALAGALLAGIAWYALQLLHVRFQVGLARWNAIYSGFGAFPVLLANIQASWLLVLIGAQVTAAFQHAPTLRALARGPRKDHADLQKLAMHVVVHLAELDHPESAHVIATGVDGDVPSTRTVLDALHEHSVVQAIYVRGHKLYALAIDPGALRAFDVIDAIDRGSGGLLLPDEDHDHVGQLLTARRQAADTSSHNVSIDELVRRKRDGAGILRRKAGDDGAADETVRDDR